jgi:hypothetical protein
MSRHQQGRDHRVAHLPSAAERRKGRDVEFTEICDYRIAPGLLTEWAPEPVASPEPDPRPPSHLQEAHVRDRAGDSPPSWLAVGFDVPGPLEPAALGRAVERWIDQHETLRSGFRVSGGVERFTVGPGQIALRPREVGSFERSGPLVDRLRGFFDAAADLRAWPPYAVATVARPESATVCLAFDHSNVDGYSMLLVPHEIRELYAQERAGRAAGLPSTGSYVDFCRIERERAPSAALVREWDEFLTGCGGTPQYPDPACAPGEHPVTQGGLHEWLLDAERADALEERCRAAGGSGFAGALLALHQATGDQLRALLLLHTRSSPEWARSVGWYVSLGPLALDGPTTDLASGLAQVRDAVGRAKELSAIAHPQLQAELRRPVKPRFVVSYMDLRAAPGSGSWREWNARALHAQSSSTDEVYLWLNRSAEGLQVTCRYPGTSTAEQHVREHVERLREAVRALAGELVPAGPRERSELCG